MLRGLISTLRPVSRISVRCISQDDENFKDLPKEPLGEEFKGEFTEKDLEEMFSAEPQDQDTVSCHTTNKDLPGSHIKIFFGDYLGGFKPIDTSKFRYPVPDMNLKAVKFSPTTRTYDILDVNSTQYFTDSRKVVLGLVGAFFPETTRTFLYDWARVSKTLQKKLYFDEVLVSSVNDPFVMKRFAEKLGFEDRMTFIADWNSEWTRYLDLEMDDEDALSAFGSRGAIYTGVAICGEFKALLSNQANGFDYTYMLSPTYFWNLCKSKRSVPRMFL